jgi:IS5 family transposase
MSKTGSANGSFFGNFIYDQLLRRRPHFLSDLSRAVDFSFVKVTLKDFYVAWGRDPWDPVLMFKMVFLQFLYDLSDRDIEEQCTWNLLFKSLLGLSAEELPPDHTVLCRFRQRLGAEGFQRLFNQVVQDADSELIVQVLTTPGNVPDGVVLPTLAQPQAKELTGDQAYDSKANRSHLAALGVASGLYPRRSRPGRPRKSWRERPQIERKFAECKQFHGLRRARYWGLTKAAVQTLMVALVVNLKRWVTLLKQRSPAFSWANAA